MSFTAKDSAGAVTYFATASGAGSSGSPYVPSHSVAVTAFPAANLGQALSAASLSATPATDIADATYIGDIKFGEALPAGSAIIGNVRVDQTTPGTTNAVALAQIAATTVSAGNGVAGNGCQRVTVASDNTAFGVKDAGPNWTPAYAYVTSSDQHSAVADVTAAPTSGQKIVVDKLVISVDTTMSITFTVETTGAVVLKLYMLANTSFSVGDTYLTKLATADKKLQYQTSVSGNVTVAAKYHSEA